MSLAVLDNLAGFAFALVGFAAVLYVAQYLPAFLYDSRVTARGIEIVAFKSLRVMTVPHEEIESCRVVGFGEVLGLMFMPWKANLIGNRWSSRWVGVARRGKRMVLLTPKNTARFIEEVRTAGLFPHPVG